GKNCSHSIAMARFLTKNRPKRNKRKSAFI
ncbi:MAG: hypothetical protein ACI81T_004552, partial [Bacteroidia bacterium]